MRETGEDFAALQMLIDASIAKAGPFLRRSLEMPEHSLTARQVADALRGMPTVAFATVTARGEPRVAPTSAIFYRAQFHIPTVMDAARTRHVLRRPGVSLTYYEGADLAIIVHGQASPIDPEQPEFAILESIHREIEGQSVRDWGDGVFLRVDAESFFTYTRSVDR